MRDSTFVLLLLAALPCWFTPCSVAGESGHHDLRVDGNRWSMMGLTRYWKNGRGGSARPRAVNVLGLRGGYRDRDVLRRYVLVSSKSDRNASSHDELRDLALTSGAAPNLHRFGVFLWDKMQNSTGAEAMYRAALKQDPGYYPAMADLGCILHRARNEPEKAEELYENVLSIEPGHVQTLCNMAWLKYHREGDAKEAEKLLRTAIQIDHDDPDVLHMLARILSESRGLHDQAELMYKRSMRANPNHIDTAWSYGAFLQDFREDDEGAKAMYRRALELDPIRYTDECEFMSDDEDESSSVYNVTWQTVLERDDGSYFNPVAAHA